MPEFQRDTYEKVLAALVQDHFFLDLLYLVEARFEILLVAQVLADHNYLSYHFAVVFAVLVVLPIHLFDHTRPLVVSVSEVAFFAAAAAAAAVLSDRNHSSSHYPLALADLVAVVADREIEAVVYHLCHRRRIPAVEDNFVLVVAHDHFHVHHCSCFHTHHRSSVHIHYHNRYSRDRLEGIGRIAAADTVVFVEEEPGCKIVEDLAFELLFHCMVADSAGNFLGRMPLCWPMIFSLCWYCFSHEVLYKVSTH